METHYSILMRAKLRQERVVLYVDHKHRVTGIVEDLSRNGVLIYRLHDDVRTLLPINRIERVSIENVL